MNSVLLPDPASVETMPPDLPSDTQIPTHVTKRLIGGTSALGASILVERGAGFLANALAARLGGASTFGAYSLAISTANNISTYAAGGIGSTAARFSGKYPMGTPGYKTLARALAVVSMTSAAVALIGLWLGAVPLAHLLHKESLTGLLRWAALSAAGIIMLECARGFFVGQRRHAAMMLLSLTVGVGMISLIPLAATRHNPVHMIVSQGLITMTAVIVCLLLARPLGLIDTVPYVSSPLGPILREVWAFGFIQLAGLVGYNLAGWWLTTLVARSDTALVQIGFFAIASQLRNIVALAPAQLTESSYAVMAQREGEDSKTPSHVMALCTFAATFASLLLASIGILLAPWGLRFYGSTYKNAAITTVVALAVAVVHMGSAPVSARLSIVSVRSTGVINTIWAIFVASAATLLMMHKGSAARAMTIYLVAHIISAALALIVVAWKDHIPNGVIGTFSLGCCTSIVLAGLAVYRDWHPELTLVLTATMAILSVVSLTVLFQTGRKKGWLPDSATVQRMIVSGKARVRGIFGSRKRGSDAS